MSGGPAKAAAWRNSAQNRARRSRARPGLPEDPETRELRAGPTHSEQKRPAPWASRAEISARLSLTPSAHGKPLRSTVWVGPCQCQSTQTDDRGPSRSFLQTGSPPAPHESPGQNHCLKEAFVRERMRTRRTRALRPGSHLNRTPTPSEQQRTDPFQSDGRPPRAAVSSARIRAPRRDPYDPTSGRVDRRSRAQPKTLGTVESRDQIQTDAPALRRPAARQCEAPAPLPRAAGAGTARHQSVAGGHFYPLAHHEQNAHNPSRQEQKRQVVSKPRRRTA